MSTPRQPEVLSIGAAPLSPSQASEIANRYFGIEAEARSLTGERDLNFHLAATDGDEYVLKFSHPAEDPLVTDFQTKALRYLAAHAPTLAIQLVVSTLAGASEAFVRIGGATRCVRLLSYLPGLPLHSVPSTPTQRRNLGRALAELDQALLGFAHPADGHVLLWDLKHVGRLAPFVDAVGDAGLRRLVGETLERHAELLKQHLPLLRSQVIHNDFNPYNVLVDRADTTRVAGIIDFGDMVRAPLVCDLAVGASYHAVAEADPLVGVLEFVAGYHGVVPIDDAEAAVLLPFIAARLAMTVAITEWRAARHPGNRDYILRNHPVASTGLRRLGAVEPNEAAARLHDVLSRGRA